MQTRNSAEAFAFRSDDTLIGILPSFDYEGTIPMLSSVAVGPFKAGIECAVPLWMALFLQQRSLAAVVPPNWWKTENLAAIIAHEKSQVSLFPTGDRLPADYYEISKRLTSTTNPPDQSEAIKLLVQDLLEIRLDKLRQQFQTLLTEAVETDLTVAVNGIGTQELAILQSFVTQALADQHALEATNKAKAAAAAPGGAEGQHGKEAAAEAAEQPVAPPVRRVPIRRFRS